MSHTRTALVTIAAAALAATALATGAGTATAAPASETEKCTSGTFYSQDQYSKVNARFCVKTIRNGNGTYDIQPYIVGDPYYYKTLGWFSDGGNGTTASSYPIMYVDNITAVNNGRQVSSGSYTDKADGGELYLSAPRTRVASGTYKVTFTGVVKNRGYWASVTGGQPESYLVKMGTHTVEGTIP
ncbi:hypothetical protein [Streptomyces sp. URMC 123]|uniref:hypothetical protein n=1 Tax=Streptomyces sp. URMC 123 TaxID=3423403 RepID=UPI003F1E419F